jgi:hypothetical protein
MRGAERQGVVSARRAGRPHQIDFANRRALRALVRKMSGYHFALIWLIYFACQNRYVAPKPTRFRRSPPIG